MKTATVESISYSIMNGLELDLGGYNYLIFCKPENVKPGGKNCEISTLKVGSKIMFAGIADTRYIDGKLIVLSDGIREVDENGNLIKW